MERFVHLLFLVFSSGCAAENITVVYGMEGGSISVHCSYKPWQQRWREKSWCRQLGESHCQQVVSARRLWLPFLSSWNGTTSIRDNIHDGVLTVTMRRLRKQDSGLYQCRTHYLGEAESLGKVRVEVLPDVLETQMPEEPRAVQSISSLPPGADLTACYITAGFLVAKLVVAVLIFVTVNSRKQREQREPSLQEQQNGVPGEMSASEQK
ncbi:triggering receptor expressed on myeloid cells 2-like [Indicator indicator]|uniref:triggering receptor expressed on myeloid cells 2-like n=1 Tax=Indicator indicator TaxID=1002788 RepID=UPI0023DEE7E0|nr:triggering receptor expressed on myeloid cells 2-like [Indicator indicator]